MPTYKNNGAIWVKKTKKGDSYLSFKAGRNIKEGESLAFFKNNYKNKENQPDYRSSEKIEDSTDKQEEKIVSDIPF